MKRIVTLLLALVLVSLALIACTEPEKAEKYAKLLYSQACLMADLPIDDPVEYTKLVCELMK